MRIKKQVSIGLLSILIAGGLDPLVGVCQTSGLTESSKILNEATQKNSGEEVLTEGTSSANTIPTTNSGVEENTMVSPKDGVTIDTSEVQENTTTQAMTNSSKVRESTSDTINSESNAKNTPEVKATESIDDWMPDKNLQEAVAASLGIATNQITKENILNLRTLKGENLGIVNLTGLEYAKNLESIELDNAEGLADLSPLKSLTSLEVLILVDSSVSDFSMFDRNTSLKKLSLSPKSVAGSETLYNNATVEQISEKFPNLEELDLRGSCNAENIFDPLNLVFPTFTGKITDISPLAKLKNLKELSVYRNQITDFSMIPPTVNLSDSYAQAFINTNIDSFEAGDNGSNYTIKFPLITGQDGTLMNIETEKIFSEPLFPDKIYNIGETFGMKNGLSFCEYYTKVSTYNQTSVEAHNSTLYTGENWNAQDNFDGAKDKDGNPVNFQDVQVTGGVDTSRPGKYKVTYSYGGVQKEIEVTVLQKVASNENSNTTRGDNNKQKQNINLTSNSSNDLDGLNSSKLEYSSLPSTGESSDWLLILGGGLFIFASIIALLRFKKDK